MKSIERKPMDSPREETLKQEGSFTTSTEEKTGIAEQAREQEVNRLSHFMQSVKTRIAVSVFVGMTSLVSPGMMRESSGGSVDDIAKNWKVEMDTIQKKYKTEIEDIRKKWETETDAMRKEYETKVENMQKKWETETERIKKGGTESGIDMKEKYANWEQYSKAFRKFQEKYASKKQTDPTAMARDFLEVIRELPDFKAETQAQRTIINEDNFKRLVGEYLRKRREADPESRLEYYRALLELQAAFYQTLNTDQRKKVEKNLGFSFLMGGGKE